MRLPFVIFCTFYSEACLSHFDLYTEASNLNTVEVISLSEENLIVKICSSILRVLPFMFRCITHVN